MSRLHRIAPGPSSRRGLSLVVILIALCSVAVLAMIAIPAWFGRPEVTLDNACSVLKHDLRAVQGRASVSRIGARLVFDEDGWRAFDSAGEPIFALGENHAIARRFSHDAVFQGVRIAEIGLGPDHAIAVDRDGQLGETGELVLEFAGETRRLRIESGAGYVLVDGSDGAPRDDARANL